MKYIQLILMAAALTMAWGCSSGSSDSSDPVDPDPIIPDPDKKDYTFVESARPDWQVDLTGNQAQPTWEDADQSQFENSMFVLVQLQDELVPYSTNDDLMALFQNEVCYSIVSHRSVHQDGTIYFALKIMGGASEKLPMSLKYYSGGLHQIFHLDGFLNFATERTYGVNEKFEPPFITGGSKYPYHSTLDTGSMTFPSDTSSDDLVGAFVSGECRGVCKVGEKLTVFGKDTGEKAEIRYYSAKSQGIYTFNEQFGVIDFSTTEIII